MITQNKPDREEVIAEIKEWISNGKVSLVGLDQSARQTKHMKSRLDLLSSALSLLTQQREDEKSETHALAKWLQVRRDDELRRKEASSEVPVKINHGAQAKAFVEALDYVRTHFAAMASTSTTEEESA
jgi:hypothetical protein